MRVTAIHGLWIIILFFTMCGCEKEAVNNPVRIEPSEISVHKGDSVEFVATGGYEYSWWLEHEEWGTLSTRKGPRVVYKALYEPEDQVEVQILYVRSTIKGDTVSGSTNSVVGGYSVSSEAYIKHLP